MSSAIPVITVDGPTASGKGTAAKRLAEDLGFHYLDSGALYRALAIAAIDAGITEESELAGLAENLPVSFGTSGEVLLEGCDVTARLREEKAGFAASEISKFQMVRDALLKLQLSFRKMPGLVTDGRDMGTVIFPDADFKFFLTASAEVRAKRRFNQLQNMGLDVNLPDLIKDIRTRDERDQNRQVSPLKPAEDAVILDSSDLDADQVFNKMLEKAKGSRSLHSE